MYRYYTNKVDITFFYLNKHSLRCLHEVALYRNTATSNSSSSATAESKAQSMRGAATPPARHRTTPPAHQPHGQ